MTESRSSASELSSLRTPAVGDVMVVGPPTVAGRPSGVDDRFFRQLVTSMRNGVVVITREGALAAVNAEAYRILNVPSNQDDIGRSFAEVFAGSPDLLRILGAAFDLTHLPNRAELRLKPSGRVIGYTLSHVLDDRQEPIGATLFFKDLTQVEQLEEKERLKDRLAALGEMAAAIAHEVKNPLASIEVLAGVLKRHLPEASDVQGPLNDIISEAKMANAIVIEVLDFVRPIRLQVEHTSIPQVLRDAVTLAESKAYRGEIHVSVDVARDLPTIRGDHNQLCQLFTNLLINAFEALEGKGSVAIRAFTERPADQASGYGLQASEVSLDGGLPGARGPEPAARDADHDGMVVIEVADDGPGVPTDINHRIFNPFFTTKPQGSGLGLAIVRKIVDAHDGWIDVSSVSGRGTRFRVTLPVSVTTEIWH
jgi:signal transduction histidine kinase